MVSANKMVIFSIDLTSSFYFRQKRVASAVMRGRWHACLAKRLGASGAGPVGKMPSSLAGGNIRMRLPRYATAYRRRYFTATVRSFGHGAVMVTVSPVTG